MNFKIVAHSLSAHLFLLHFAGIQWTAEFSSGDRREVVCNMKAEKYPFTLILILPNIISFRTIPWFFHHSGIQIYAA